MLGRNRPVVTLDDLEHPLVDLGTRSEEVVLAHMLRLEDVQVQVAVTNMAVPHHFIVRVMR
ncbi:hypothetical protein D3C81_1864800 [compost metagenome]